MAVQSSKRLYAKEYVPFLVKMCPCLDVSQAVNQAR
jgi:hypothetical protein